MSGQRVGVVGASEIAPAIEAAGGIPVVDPEAFGSVRFVVAAGEPAIVDLVRGGIDVPVVAVSAGAGLRSVPFERLEAALTEALEAAVPVVDHPIIEVTGGFEPIRAVFDVGLMAAEPARISEFAVRSGGERVSRFRADGVVASTPAGSGGYNRNAGGPVLAPGTGVASVVPIAPFATAPGRWIVPLDSIELAVKRDETPVELLVDGRREAIVDPGGSVTVSRVGTLETHVLSASRSPF